MTREELLAAVEAWEGVAERVSQAIAERDHRRCVVANREGDKLFREVKIYIKQLDGAAMEDDLKTLVMAAMGRWLEVAKAATLLNEDIRREIDSIRRRRKNGRNIGQMYLGQGSPSGRNLRIKAK